MIKIKDMPVFKYRFLYVSLCLYSVLGASLSFAQNAPTQLMGQTASRPVLKITNSPVPKSILQKAYSYPTQSPEISPSEVVGSAYYRPTETMVSRKLRDLVSELAILQDKVVLLSKALGKLQQGNETRAAEYFAAVATINTQLQVGTTPGNPRLLNKYSVAERALEELSTRLTDFNNLSIDASKVATEASFLLDSSRATYGLSGAVEEDHVNLAETEDKINTMIVLLERILNTVNEDIARTRAYMLSERDNLRTLSIAIANGSLYGVNLADRPFSGVRNISYLAASAQQQQQQQAYAQPMGQQQMQAGYMPPPPPGFFEAMQQQGIMVPSGMQGQVMQPVEQQQLPPVYASEEPMYQEPAYQETVAMAEPQALAAPQEPVYQRAEPAFAQPMIPSQSTPLVKIKFERNNVDYEGALLAAVDEVLDRYPQASFNVVALHSTLGGAASTAIESTRSRRNAQKVMRSLTQVGVPSDRIEVSYEPHSDIDVNEVHLYIY